MPHHRITINGRCAPQLYTSPEAARSSVIDWCDAWGIEVGKARLDVIIGQDGVPEVDAASEARAAE